MLLKNINDFIFFFLPNYEWLSIRVNESITNIVVWGPFYGLLFLLLLKILDLIIEPRWITLENYQNSPLNSFFFVNFKSSLHSLIYKYRFIILLVSFFNLFFALLAYRYVVIYSAYGLYFFQHLKSFYFFGFIKDFSLIFDEFIAFFVLLNAFVIFCCLVFVCLNKTYYLFTDIIRRAQLLLLTQFFANLAFMSSDMLGFYIFYEAILIPVFFLIGIWGSSQRRIKAAYFFFFFYPSFFNADVSWNIDYQKIFTFN